MTVTKLSIESAGTAGSIEPAPKVLHIITALGTGGAERQLQSLMQYSTSPSSAIALYEGGIVADAMRESGERVTELGLGQRGGFGKLGLLRRLVQLIRAEAPDVVHVHLLAAQLWGIPAARLAGVRRIISSEHSLMDTTIENRPLTTPLRWVYRFLERLSSHTVAVSPTTRDRLRKWGVADHRVTVVNNGIDFAALTFSADRRRDIRAQWRLDENAVVIGAVGRLEPVKRFPQLLAALAPWLLDGDRHLVIVGTGPLHDQLAAQATALGVSDRVRLLGARSDIPAILSGLDVLVSPSRDETFGMAVIEALGAGLPVIYAQCPALEDLETLPPNAFPLDAFGADLHSETELEATAIASAVRSALSPVSGPKASGMQHVRWPVPDSVEITYGIESAAAEIDSLYSAATIGGSAK